MLRQTKKKYIISAASLLFLFVATASGFFLVKKSQDNRQQASGVCQPGDPYCSCDFWGSNCVLVNPDGSRTIVEQGSDANNNGVLSTSYTGDRPTTESACGGIWMSDFCYMPGDEIAGGYVVVESGKYNYPYLEKKEVYESINYGAETVNSKIGSTESLGENCGGKGLAINGICYAYGSTINGYLVMPDRTSGCDNSTGDYCYAHLEKIEVTYNDWDRAVSAYEVNGDISQLEELYKATYGIDFDSSYLYDVDADNKTILRAQALISALTNAEVLQADAAAINALLEEKDELTAEEQALYDYNQKIIEDELFENRLSTVDQLANSTVQQTTINKAVQEMYQDLVVANSGELSNITKDKFKEIFGYDPTEKYGGLDSVLDVFGIDAEQLERDRNSYAIWVIEQEQAALEVQKAQEEALLAEQIAAGQLADAEQLAAQQRSDSISQAISDYAGGTASERDFKKMAVSSGFISQQQSDLMTIDEILAYIYKSNPDVSTAEAREFADNITSTRSNIIMEQSLMTSYQNDPTNRGALLGLYELYKGYEAPSRMTTERLVYALAEENPQIALQAYLVSDSISYLQDSYAKLNGLNEGGALVSVVLPTDEEVLLKGIFGDDYGSQIYSGMILPGLINDALTDFAENPDDLEDICSRTLGGACNIDTENATEKLGAMFSVVYSDRDDININELAVSYSNQLLASAEEEKKDSFWEMFGANLAMSMSGDGLAIASLTSETAADAFESQLEYQSETMANYSQAIETTKIFDAQDTFEYAVMVKPDLSDYTFGMSMGNAFMYDNVFGGDYDKREDLGLSTWDSIGMGWNQIETQVFGVTSNVDNIATNYATAMALDYTGPANTYVADIAMQAGSNLQFADVNNPGQYVTAVDNYTAAADGYYVGQAATNVGATLADWTVTAGTYIALANQNTPTYYGTAIGQDLLTPQEIKDQAIAAGDQVKADIQNNFYTNQAANYVDQNQFQGINDPDLVQDLVTDQVQNFVDFQTDEEIVRSRQEMNWETVEKVVAPTAAVVALPIAIASGAGIGVVAGMASSAFSLYQGAGMKAQALDLETAAVGRYNLEAGDFYENGVNIAAQDLVNNPIITETGETITYTYDEALELIESQEEMLNKQANMMLASAAVSSLTSGAGIINGFTSGAQATLAAGGTVNGLTQTAISTANAMGVVGRVGGIALSGANAYNSAQTLFDENASAGEKWMSGLSTFVAASGVVGNTFGFINNPTGATQAITTKTDLILDVMNIPAGVAIDMQQVSKACYDDDYPGDETACRDAWIGLALSLTQDIAQTTSSVNAYRQYQSDDALQKITSVDTEINKILNNPNRTIGENLDLGELQLRRDNLIASALAINPNIKIPEAPVTTLVKTNISEIRTEDLMQTAVENRSTLLSRAAELEGSNPTLAAQLRQQADDVFNRQFEISNLGDEIRAIDKAIDQDFDKISSEYIEELRGRRVELVSELDSKVNDPAYQAHNLTIDNKQLTIALKENEVFKAYDDFKAAEQEQLRLEQQNLPPPVGDLTKQTGLATLLPRITEQNKALDLIEAQNRVAEISKLTLEKNNLENGTKTIDSLLRIEEIDKQLNLANTELNKIVESAENQSFWQRVKNILPGSQTEKTYNEAILALKDLNQYNQDNIRLEELSDKHSKGDLSSDERQEFNQLLDDLEGVDQRYTQSQEKVSQAILGVSDSLQNSRASFGAIAFVNKTAESIKNFFAPSAEVKQQRRLQSELATSKNDLDLLGRYEKLTSDLDNYRLELVKSEEALANATDTQRSALESDIKKYNQLIGDAEKQIASIEKNIDVNEARNKYFQGIVDSEAQKALEAAFDGADLTAFRQEVENLKNADLDRLDLADAERALLDQILASKEVINTSKNIGASDDIEAINQAREAISQARTEYAEALTELNQRILGESPDAAAYQKLGNLQNVIKKNDLLGTVTADSQIKNLLASTEIKLNTEDPLVAAQMATIIRDIEFRTGATEGVQFFNARTNQVDTMLKILNGDRVAVELTTAGGKTFVGAAVLKTQTEVMGYETGIYIAKPGQETAVQSAMAIAYGVDVNKIPILDNSRLSDPDYVNSLKEATFIIADPAQVQFIRNTALNIKDPNFKTAVEIYSKLTNEVALYVDELQITLDPSRQAINSVGPSTADIPQTYKDTASLIGQALDQTVLKNGGWGVGDNDFLVLRTQDGADIAKFSKDAQGQIFSRLADEMGISSQKYGAIAENATEIERALGQGEDVLLARLSELGVDGVDVQKATQILDQIDMLNSFAQGLKMQKGTDYIRAVDNVLAKNGGPDRNVTIPAAGGVSNEGQSYKANLQVAMEYIGARAYGDSVNFSGLKSSPNEAFRSNISSYFASLKNSAVGAVTGAMADGAGVAEVSLGLTTYRSTEAVDKIVGIEGIADGGRIVAERSYAVGRGEDVAAVVALKNSGKLDISDGEASNGNLKIVMGTDGAEDPLNFAINLANDTAFRNSEFAVQNADGSYSKIVIENGKVVSEAPITTKQIQDLYDNGAENLVTIIGRGGATGDSIRTAGNIPGITITSQKSPVGLVAQAGARIDRGSDIADQYALIITPSSSRVDVDKPMSVAEFSQFKNGVIENQKIVEQAKNTQALDQGVVTASNRVLESLVFDSDNERVQQWASDLLLKFSTESSQRDLDLDGGSQSSLLARQNKIESEVSKWKDVLADPTNASILRQISADNPEAYRTILSNAGVDATKLAYANTAVDANTTKESVITADNLDDFIRRHNLFVAKDSESEFVASSGRQVQAEQIATKEQQNTNDAVRVTAEVEATKNTIRELAEVVTNPIKMAAELGKGGVVSEVLKAPARVIDYAKNLDAVQDNAITNYRAQRESLANLESDLASETDVTLQANLQDQIDGLKKEIAAVPFLTKASSFVDTNITGGAVRERVASWFNSEEAVPGLNDSKKAVVAAIGGASWWNQRALRSVATTEELYNVVKDQFSSLNTRRPAINSEEQLNENLNLLSERVAEIKDLQEQSGLEFIEFDRQGRPVLDADGNFVRVNDDLYKDLSTFRDKANSEIKKLAKVAETAEEVKDETGSEEDEVDSEEVSTDKEDEVSVDGTVAAEAEESFWDDFLEDQKLALTEEESDEIDGLWQNKDDSLLDRQQLVAEYFVDRNFTKEEIKDLLETEYSKLEEPGFKNNFAAVLGLATTDEIADSQDEVRDSDQQLDDLTALDKFLNMIADFKDEKVFPTLEAIRDRMEAFFEDQKSKTPDRKIAIVNFFKNLGSKGQVAKQFLPKTLKWTKGSFNKLVTVLEVQKQNAQGWLAERRAESQRKDEEDIAEEKEVVKKVAEEKNEEEQIIEDKEFIAEEDERNTNEEQNIKVEENAEEDYLTTESEKLKTQFRALGTTVRKIENEEEFFAEIDRLEALITEVRKLEEESGIPFLNSETTDENGDYIVSRIDSSKNLSTYRSEAQREINRLEAEKIAEAERVKEKEARQEAERIAEEKRAKEEAERIAEEKRAKEEAERIAEEEKANQERKLSIRWQAINSFVEGLANFVPQSMSISELKKNISSINRLIEVNSEKDFSPVVSTKDFNQMLENMRSLASSLIQQKEINTTDLEELYTIGRSDDNFFISGASFVSRKHAVILKDKAGNLFIKDIGSTKGTFINGQKIEVDEVVALKKGDFIEMGMKGLSAASIAVIDFNGELSLMSVDGFDSELDQKRREIQAQEAERLRVAGNNYISRVNDGENRFINNSQQDFVLINPLNGESKTIRKGSTFELNTNYLINVSKENGGSSWFMLNEDGSTQSFTIQASTTTADSLIEEHSQRPTWEDGSLRFDKTKIKSVDSVDILDENGNIVRTLHFTDKFNFPGQKLLSSKKEKIDNFAANVAWATFRAENILGEKKKGSQEILLTSKEVCPRAYANSGNFILSYRDGKDLFDVLGTIAHEHTHAVLGHSPLIDFVEGIAMEVQKEVGEYENSEFLKYIPGYIAIENYNYLARMQRQGAGPSATQIENINPNKGMRGAYEWSYFSGYFLINAILETQGEEALSKFISAYNQSNLDYSLRDSTKLKLIRTNGEKVSNHEAIEELLSMFYGEDQFLLINERYVELMETSPFLDVMDKVEGVTYLGRDADNDIVANQGSVSRVHALVAKDSLGFLYISDLKSSNGTYVNGNRIDSNYRLSGGDEIILGSLNGSHSVLKVVAKKELNEHKIEVETYELEAVSGVQSEEVKAAKEAEKVEKARREQLLADYQSYRERFSNLAKAVPQVMSLTIINEQLEEIQLIIESLGEKDFSEVAEGNNLIEKFKSIADFYVNSVREHENLVDEAKFLVKEGIVSPDFSSFSVTEIKNWIEDRKTEIIKEKEQQEEELSLEANELIDNLETISSSEDPDFVKTLERLVEINKTLDDKVIFTKIAFYQKASLLSEKYGVNLFTINALANDLLTLESLEEELDFYLAKLNEWGVSELEGTSNLAYLLMDPQIVADGQINLVSTLVNLLFRKQHHAFIRSGLSFFEINEDGDLLDINGEILSLDEITKDRLPVKKNTEDEFYIDYNVFQEAVELRSLELKKERFIEDIDYLLDSSLKEISSSEELLKILISQNLEDLVSQLIENNSGLKSRFDSLDENLITKKELNSYVNDKVKSWLEEHPVLGKLKEIFPNFSPEMINEEDLFLENDLKGKQAYNPKILESLLSDDSSRELVEINVDDIIGTALMNLTERPDANNWWDIILHQNSIHRYVKMALENGGGNAWEKIEIINLGNGKYALDGDGHTRVAVLKALGVEKVKLKVKNPEYHGEKQIANDAVEALQERLEQGLWEGKIIQRGQKYFAQVDSFVHPWVFLKGWEILKQEYGIETQVEKRKQAEKLAMNAASVAGWDDMSLDDFKRVLPNDISVESFMRQLRSFENSTEDYSQFIRELEQSYDDLYQHRQFLQDPEYGNPRYNLGAFRDYFSDEIIRRLNSIQNQEIRDEALYDSVRKALLIARNLQDLYWSRNRSSTIEINDEDIYQFNNLLSEIEFIRERLRQRQNQNNSVVEELIRRSQPFTADESGETLFAFFAQRIELYYYSDINLEKLNEKSLALLNEEFSSIFSRALMKYVEYSTFLKKFTQLVEQAQDLKFPTSWYEGRDYRYIEQKIEQRQEVYKQLSDNLLVLGIEEKVGNEVDFEEQLHQLERIVNQILEKEEELDERFFEDSVTKRFDDEGDLAGFRFERINFEESYRVFLNKEKSNYGGLTEDDLSSLPGELIDEYGTDLDAIQDDIRFKTALEVYSGEILNKFLHDFYVNFELADAREVLGDNLITSNDDLINQIVEEYVKLIMTVDETGKKSFDFDLQNVQKEILESIADSFYEKYRHWFYFSKKTDLFKFRGILLLEGLFNEVLSRIRTAVDLSPKMKEMIKFALEEDGMEGIDPSLVELLLTVEEGEINENSSWSENGKMSKMVDFSKKAETAENMINQGASVEEAFKVFDGEVSVREETSSDEDSEDAKWSQGGKMADLMKKALRIEELEENGASGEEILRFMKGEEDANDSKNFQNSCSSCSEVREQTKEGLQEADRLWTEAQAQYAANNKREGDKLKKQALSQIKKTKKAVINEHGMQNQCVQMYLNAWADTREAEIRQTRFLVNKANNSVEKAIEIAEAILKNRKIDLLERKGFLGIGRKINTIDVEEQDLVEVNEILDGNKDIGVLGLKDMEVILSGLLNPSVKIEDFSSESNAEIEANLDKEAQEIISHFYNKYPISKENLDRAKKTQIYVTDQKELAAKIVEWLDYKGVIDSKVEDNRNIYEDLFSNLGVDFRFSQNQLDQQKFQIIEALLNEFKLTGGVALDFADHDVILINSELYDISNNFVLRHELLHILSGHGLKNISVISENLDVYDMYHELNEGATQLIELFDRYALSEKDLLGKILDGEIQTPYRTQVTQLLAIMMATAKDGIVQVSVNDLANYYFSNEEGLGANLFRINIFQNVNPSVKEATLSILEKLYATGRASDQLVSELKIEEDVEKVIEQIVTPEDAVDLIKNKFDLGEDFVRNYYDAAVKAGIGKKLDEDTYELASMEARFLSTNINFGFFKHVIHEYPELYPLILNYQNMKVSGEDISPEVQQIFINNLLSPDKKIFFNQKGEKASLEDYFKDLYGEKVEIIRIDVEKLDEETLKRLEDLFTGEELSKFKQMSNQLPIATVLIKKGDKEFRVPIISSKTDDSIMAFATNSKELSSYGLLPIVVNTNLKKRSLFDIITTITHEVDHAVHNVANPLDDNYFHTDFVDKGDKVIKYLFEGRKYSQSVIGELSKRALENDRRLNELEVNSLSLMITAISEMGGETSSLRFLRSFAKGIGINGEDELLSSQLEFAALSHLAERFSSVSFKSVLPYALGIMLGETISNEYGDQELLRVINDIPMEMSRYLFEEALNEGEKILLAKKDLLFDLTAMSSIYAPDSIKVDINDLDFQSNSKQETPIDFEKEEEGLREKLENSMEKISIFERVFREIPSKPGQWLENVNSLFDLTHYLSDENKTFRDYVANSIDNIDNDQAYEDLSREIEMMFVIFEGELDSKVFSSEELRRFVFDFAFNKVVEEYRFVPDLDSSLSELEDLLEILFTDSDYGKFSKYTGQSLGLPLKKNEASQEVVDLEKLNLMMERLKLEIKYRDLLSSHAIHVNLTDNPSLEETKQRFEEAIRAAGLPVQEIIKFYNLIDQIFPNEVDLGFSTYTGQSLKLPIVTDNDFFKEFDAEKLQLMIGRLELELEAKEVDLFETETIDLSDNPSLEETARRVNEAAFRVINNKTSSVESSESDSNSKNFQNSCSSCSEVREQTKEGLQEADNLWLQSQEQFKLAEEKYAEAESLQESGQKDQAEEALIEAKNAEKQAEQLKKQALDQIDKTRKEVVNEHGMQNQCVQMYLNAWADTREAELRQTRTAVNRAIDSVYDATLIAKEILETGHMILLERPGFLGIGRKENILEVGEEDLEDVREILEGSENVFGLEEMIEFGISEAGELDIEIIIGGSLFENSFGELENSSFLNNILGKQREEINELVEISNSLTEEQVLNYQANINNKIEKVKANSFHSVKNSEVEDLISGLEGEINQEIESISGAQLPSIISEYDLLNSQLNVFINSSLIKNQRKVNFISSLPKWLQKLFAYDLEKTDEETLENYLNEHLENEIAEIKESLNSPINSYQDLEAIGLKIESLVDKSSELISKGFLSNDAFSELFIKEVLKNKEDSSLSFLLRVKLLGELNVLVETYLSLTANYGETVLNRVSQKQTAIEALSMANISVTAEHNQSVRSNDPAFPYLNEREKINSLISDLASLYQLEIDGDSEINIYKVRENGLKQPVLNTKYNASVSSNIIYLLSAYKDPLEAKKEIKSYISALMNEENTSKWDELIKKGSEEHQQQYYGYRSSFNNPERIYDYGIENLALVHLTDFEPNVEDGYLSISNTNESAGAFRTSLHFSVQSPVHDVSAMGKLTSWKDKDIAFIIPFKEAVEVNGSPVNVFWQDTFWGLGLDERFILPAGSVVLLKPGHPQEEEFRQIEGINVVIVDESRTVWEQVYFVMQDMGFKPDLMQQPIIGDEKDLASELFSTSQLHMALMGGLYEGAERGFDNSALAMNTNEEEYLDYINIVNGDKDGDLDRAVGSLIRMGHFTYGGDLGLELYPHLRKGRFEFSYGDYPLPDSDVRTYDYDPARPEGLYDSLYERVGQTNLHLTPRYEAVVKFNIMSSTLWRYPWFLDMVLSNFSINSSDGGSLKDLLGITDEELNFIYQTKTEVVPQLNKVFNN